MRWHDGPFVCELTDDEETCLIGQVSRKGGCWEAFDTNTDGEPKALGLYKDLEKAKKKVEENFKS